eukprot:9073787-Pyramimonas_sp.AAC.2
MPCRVVTLCSRCPPSARCAPFFARVFSSPPCTLCRAPAFPPLELVLRGRLYQQPPPAALALASWH